MWAEKLWAPFCAAIERPDLTGDPRFADDLALPVRSMGMSADLEIAVEEGSTMIRVGSGLFGPRRHPNHRPD